MSEPLFKAVWRFSISEYLAGDPRGVDTIGTRASKWLRDNEREAHYVNSYLNDTKHDDQLEWVVVLNDRDTALLLKLALA